MDSKSPARGSCDELVAVLARFRAVPNFRLYEYGIAKTATTSSHTGLGPSTIETYGYLFLTVPLLTHLLPSDTSVPIVTC